MKDDKITVSETDTDDCPKEITPWYIITLLKPVIREEFIATFRYDRTGIRMKFPNGQQFHLSVTEMN